MLWCWNVMGLHDPESGWCPGAGRPQHRLQREGARTARARCLEGERDRNGKCRVNSGVEGRVCLNMSTDALEGVVESAARECLLREWREVAGHKSVDEFLTDEEKPASLGATGEDYATLKSRLRTILRSRPAHLSGFRPASLLASRWGAPAPVPASTGIATVDHLWQGGLRPGQLLHVSGAAGSGKTRLCFALALRNRCAYRVFYVDTQNNGMEWAACQSERRPSDRLASLGGCRVFTIEHLMRVLAQVAAAERRRACCRWHHPLDHVAHRPLLLIVDALSTLLAPLSTTAHRHCTYVGRQLRHVAAAAAALVVVVCTAPPAAHAAWPPCGMLPASHGPKIHLIDGRTAHVDGIAVDIGGAAGDTADR
eukprot:ctg_2356.g436